MTFLQHAGIAVLLVVLSLFLQCAGAAAVVTWLRRATAKDSHNVQLLHSAALVMQTAVAVILVHGIIILLWASFYRWLCFPSWESAFYFSASSYATVGYGDLVPSSKWRFLGPLEGMIGLLMSGITVGLLVALITWLLDGEARSRATKASGA